MPISEMTTVQPAKSTARPDVSRASTTAPRVAALVQALAVPGDDEQRVVDAHADADHGGQLGAERRHDQPGGEQGDDGEADADAEQGGEDRQAHGEHRAEGDEQDDDGGEDADGLARATWAAGRLAMGWPPSSTWKPVAGAASAASTTAWTVGLRVSSVSWSNCTLAKAMWPSVLTGPGRPARRGPGRRPRGAGP